MLRINERIFIALLPSLKCFSSTERIFLFWRPKSKSVLAKKKQAHFHVELKKVTFEVVIGFQCSQIDFLWRFFCSSHAEFCKQFFTSLSICWHNIEVLIGRWWSRMEAMRDSVKNSRLRIVIELVLFGKKCEIAIFFHGSSFESLTGSFFLR